MEQCRVKTYSLNERHLTMRPHQDIGYYNILDDKTFKDGIPMLIKIIFMVIFSFIIGSKMVL